MSFSISLYCFSYTFCVIVRINFPFILFCQLSFFQYPLFIQRIGFFFFSFGLFSLIIDFVLVEWIL